MTWNEKTQFHNCSGHGVQIPGCYESRSPIREQRYRGEKKRAKTRGRETANSIGRPKVMDSLPHTLHWGRVIVWTRWIIELSLSLRVRGELRRGGGRDVRRGRVRGKGRFGSAETRRNVKQTCHSVTATERPSEVACAEADSNLLASKWIEKGNASGLAVHAAVHLLITCFR